MVSINIRTNFPEVQRQLDQLQKDIGEKAAVSAVNKTMAKAKTKMGRTIVSEFRVTVGQVRDRLDVEKAKYIRGRAVITAVLTGRAKRRGMREERGMNLIAFVEKSVSLAQARKRAKAGTLDQLHFQIKRAGGKVVIPGAFIGNKGRTVFKRVGKERLPIKAVTTIGIEQMFNTKRINRIVVEAMKADFPGIFEHEAAFFTRRFNERRAAA